MTFDTVTEDRPLRAVIAGAGFIGRQWATELLLHPDVSLVGWADIDPSKVPSGRGVPAFGSVAEMVEAVRPDFLVNGTVPAAHHEVTLATLERGCRCSARSRWRSPSRRARTWSPPPTGRAACSWSARTAAICPAWSPTGARWPRWGSWRS
ncbi:Gfo/Idh/MocA family oxidoreductase [Nonomuraea recticatena]|uniref:Gfo/Idh/MocA family oxidoreductase n=1 Tax=Nonomuraea recticatena TaxID=46178 RepID=UPI0036151603